ncbi:antirestriction protein ArdA, partial [Klebsiella pneumoniae]|uniref:antirestriction protein ArdA n=1 Tax=Klebsiella pneumoniae TaxID=573 RepID=UPI002159FD30
MTSSVTVPAVYVGTYHQYNGGSIFGKWFDLTDFDDEDEFYDACRALHAAEDDPEFMFQDWEGIPSQFASESSVKWAFIEAFRQAQDEGHCCKVSDEAAFCLIQRPYISKTLLT